MDLELILVILLAALTYFKLRFHYSVTNDNSNLKSMINYYLSDGNAIHLWRFHNVFSGNRKLYAKSNIITLIIYIIMIGVIVDMLNN
jgi:hypothetical protein